MARHPEVPNFIIVFFIKLTQDLRKINREAQAKQLENTQLLPQRGKSCSVSGLALLDLRSRNHARSAFKRFSHCLAFASSKVTFFGFKKGTVPFLHFLEINIYNKVNVCLFMKFKLLSQIILKDG
jgi:hypothetical protein